MAAYSYHYIDHLSFLDSIYLPNNANNNSSIDLLSQSNFPSEPLVEEVHGAVESSCTAIDHNSSTKVASSDNEPSVTKRHTEKQSKQSTESSTVVDKLEIGEQVTQKMAPMAKKRKPQSKAANEHKGKNQKKLDGAKKSEEKEIKPDKKVEVKIGEEASKGYIHVRARRGQATDSHSLAERVRREKISERMKMLQTLVPGCDKVTGRAVMLDEIINYVQSLQNQIEFLSMKLATLNPMSYDFGMDLSALMVKPERMSSMEPPFPSKPQCSPTQPIPFADTSTNIATTTMAATTPFTTPNNYPFLDSSASLLLQYEQRPNAFSQESDSFLCHVEDQRQNFLNPSGFSNNLCSFH